MRLIDLDSPRMKDLNGFEEKFMGQTVLEWLNDMPTVNAVPRDWWEELRGAIMELREINEYDTDSEIYQVAKVLLDSMNVFEGKGGEDDE